MWQQGKRFYCSYPFLITTLVFALFGLLSWLRLGTEAVAYVCILFMAAVGIVAREYNKHMDHRTYLERKLSSERGDYQLQLVMEAARSGYWFGKYIECRKDRAAILKALTAVHPAGYRDEYYLVESPHEYSHYGRSSDLQWFIYIDLPEESNLPHPQLRFAVSPEEMRLIGDLPDYNKQRITLLEADAQESLRLYLLHEAYDQLKENEDATASPVAEPA